MTGPGPTLLDLLANLLRRLEQQPYRPTEYVVHPAEAAWIRNPEGPPPTRNAVRVAAEIGAINAHHPALHHLTSGADQPGGPDD